MALSFTEGSIGGDIERADLAPARRLLRRRRASARARRGRREPEPGGSNGIAIAPPLTRDGHALLLINPHTSFFFRSELGMESGEGLHAYGASTWGQFFIYQGFNERVGWMHTSSGVDSVDEFAETIVRRGERFFYRYGRRAPPSRAAANSASRSAAAQLRDPQLHHLPHPSRPHRPRRWRALDRAGADAPPGRGAAAELAAHQGARFRRLYAASPRCRPTAPTTPSMPMPTATSPICIRNSCRVRDDRFDYRDPVDGSDPATDWRGLTPLVRRCRTSAIPARTGSTTPMTRPGAPPAPTARAAPISRATWIRPAPIRAATMPSTLLDRARALTPEGLRRIAYNPWMPFFREMRSGPGRGLDGAARAPIRVGARLQRPVAVLRDWDETLVGRLRRRPPWPASGANELWAAAERQRPPHGNMWEAMNALSGRDQLDALARAVDRLEREWGGWRVALGRGEPLPAQRRARSSRPSTTPAQHPGPVRLGPLGLARLLRRRAPIRARGAGTAPAATASSRWSSSAPASAPGRSPPAAKAAIRPRRISTTRPSAMRRATCARSISTARTWRAMSSETYHPGQARASR